MHKTLIASAAAAFVLAGSFAAGPVRAAGLDILQATLAEKGATPEISTAEMRVVIADKSAIVLDTRSRAEFDAGHLPGAINIQSAPAQYAEAVARATGGDYARALVLYCNGPFCQASRRMAEQLAKDGFSNVRRYQLGMPVWRALGGPVQVEAAGIARILGADRTAVFVDVRARADFAKGSIANAINAPADELVSGKLDKIALPEDDFNCRIIIFGRDGSDAVKVAMLMSTRPWHNVMYFAGNFEDIAATRK
jgi:rhodanese-related sulfurtransferase